VHGKHIVRNRRKRVVFKARYVIGPAHVKVRLFVGKNRNTTYAKLGDLTLRVREWEQSKDMLECGNTELVDDTNVN